MADRSVKVNLGANVTGFVNGMRTAQGAARDFTAKGLDRIEQRSASITTLSNTAGIMGAGMVAGFGAATKAAIDWESAWAGVLKTVDGSSSELAALEDSLREMARTMPVTHQEIAAVAEAAGQLGVATPDVAEFTETMLQLGVTTNLTAEEAATSLARISNIMGTSTDDVSRMGATIVDLGNNSATTEREIVELATRLAAAGRQAGLTEADIFAIASTLTSVGVEAEAGGTAMSKVFTSIADAARDGGENLETFASVAGLTAEEFRRAFEEDAAGAIGMFVEGMGRLASEGESTSQVFKDLGLTDQRLMRAIMSAGSATGLWADQLDLAGVAWGDNSAHIDEFGKRLETAQSQMTIAWNNIRDAAIEFGAVVLPMIADVAGSVSDLATEFGELPDWVKSATMAIAGGGGLALLGVAALGKLLVATAAVKTAMDGLGVSAGAARGKVALLGQALGVLSVGALADQIMAMSGAATVASVDIAELTADLEAMANGAEDVGPALAEMLESGEDWALFHTEVKTAEEALDAFGSVAREALGQDFLDKLDRVGTSAADMAALREVTEQLDASFAEMVASGNIDGATEAFDRFMGAAKEQNVDMTALIELFPQYRGAIEAAGESALVSAGGQDALGAATGDTTGAVEDQTDAISDLIAAQADLAGVALSQREAQRGLEAAVDDLTDSLAANGNTFDITTVKGRANQAALDNIASSTWDLIESMRANDATQQQMHGVMETSRARFIAAAIAADIGADAANDLADELNLIPAAVNTDISADTSAARGAVNALVRDISNRVATIQVRATMPDLNGAASGSGRMGSFAAGGPVFGPGTATSDSIPARLSNGEHVLSAAEVKGLGGHAMVASMRATARSGGPMMFAQGGSPGYRGATAPGLAPNVTVLVENPWTGEVLETRARVVARDELDARGVPTRQQSRQHAGVRR